MVMMSMSHNMPPGAADKWKVLQLFYETMPRGSFRIDNIDRVASPERFGRFREVEGRENEEEWEIGFCSTTDPIQLARLESTGFDDEDINDALGSKSVMVSSSASSTHASTYGALTSEEQPPNDHCVFILLCAPGTLGRAKEKVSEGKDKSTLHAPREQCVSDPRRLFVAYVLRYRPADGREESATAPLPLENEQLAQAERKRQLARRRTTEYARVREPLIREVLQGLEHVAPGIANAVLLPSSSEEAEAVVSLYLLGGGGSRGQRAPGVDKREALGGVVVQRIENSPLFRDYCAVPLDGMAERKFREDVVWHGTRLKRTDGEGASLATKLQSIAENGFDPKLCVKGAAAEGGIWLATNPLASFGHGCDGLVAFVLCLAKTNFNEWLDSTCARVLARERVLPLYSLVHT